MTPTVQCFALVGLLGVRLCIYARIRTYVRMYISVGGCVWGWVGIGMRACEIWSTYCIHPPTVLICCWHASVLLISGLAFHGRLTLWGMLLWYSRHLAHSRPLRVSSSRNVITIEKQQSFLQMHCVSDCLCGCLHISMLHLTFPRVQCYVMCSCPVWSRCASWAAVYRICVCTCSGVVLHIVHTYVCVHTYTVLCAHVHVSICKWMHL